MFRIENAEEFKRNLGVALSAMKVEADQVFRGFVTAVFHRLATETPQWSGNAVSNWNVSVTGPDMSVTFALKTGGKQHGNKIIGDEEGLGSPVSKGDPRAIGLALSRAKGTLGSLTLENGFAPGVYITNAAKELDGESYIQYLEENPNGFLRTVNEPGHMLERVVNTAHSLGRLSPVLVEALRFLKPGDTNNSGIGL